MSFIKFDLKEDFYTKEEIESELEDLNVLIEDLQDRLDSLSLNIDGEGVLRLTTDDNNNVYVGNLYTTKSYVDNKVSEILTRLGVSSSENGVLLLGNKSVIQSGDVATFIVTVYGENNLVVSDEEVTFEFYSSIDDSLLDTIVKTTTFKGIASCTYTGVGRGSVYCKASIQRNNSSIVSEIYEVLDALFYEDGTTGTPNPNWVKNGGNFDVTPSTDGILISNTFTWAVYYRANLGDTSTTQDYTIPVCVEFDYIEASDNSKWYLQFDDGSDRSIRGDVIQVTNDCHVTIRATSTDTYVKVDNGTERALGYVVASPTGVALRLQGVASLKFKNFKIYPI